MDEEEERDEILQTWDEMSIPDQLKWFEIMMEGISINLDGAGELLRRLMFAFHSGVLKEAERKRVVKSVEKFSAALDQYHKIAKS